MERREYPPGDRAPDNGRYEELNVFGAPTGRTATMEQGQELPPAPQGFTWREVAAA